MALGRFWKWILGLGVVGGGIALASSAGASEGPNPAKGAKGVRAGVAFDGCKHFELQDVAAFKSWALANAMQLQVAIGVGTTLEDLREDPERAATPVFHTLFPECQSPEDATWGPERVTYLEALARVKAQLEGLEGAPASDPTSAIAELVIRALAGVPVTGPKVPPVPPGPPVPPPPMDAGGEPSPAGDVLELVDTAGFEAAEVMAVLDPGAGTSTDVPRTVLVGYSEGWTGAAETIARMQQLAAEQPDVEWLLFSFVKSRELFGLPDAPLAYVATAVDPNGVPMGTQIASTNLGSPALGEARWAHLLEYARHGYPTPPGSMLDVVAKGDQGYTVLLSPPKEDGNHAWAWMVWEGPRQAADKAIAKGSSLGPDKAREHARAAIAAA